MNETVMLYMADIESNYIKEFEAEVYRNGKDFVVLDRSAFYPEGGGQPTDKGHLVWGDGQKAIVEKVQKKGEVLHRLDGPIPSEGQTVTGSLDWDRRFAHMRMHTAQHLVSAIVYDLFGSDTVGNQIHDDRSRIDFHPSSLSEDDLKEIEAKANEMIEQKIPVQVYESERESLKQKGSHLRVNLDLLPKSVRRLRIIEIDGYDICPCAGTHVRNLSEIGNIDVLKKRSKGKDKERLEYTLREDTG